MLPSEVKRKAIAERDAKILEMIEELRIKRPPQTEFGEGWNKSLNRLREAIQR